jgi:hypothetical protein
MIPMAKKRKQWTPLEPTGMHEAEARLLYDDISSEYPELIFVNPAPQFEDGTRGIQIRYGDEATFTIRSPSEWNQPSKLLKKLIEAAIEYGEEMRLEP